MAERTADKPVKRRKRPAPKLSALGERKLRADAERTGIAGTKITNA